MGTFSMGEAMDLRKNDDGTVSVGDYTTSGFLARNRSCRFCGFTPAVYLDDHDAYACPKCRKWLESACSDPDCNYCRNRPAEPFGF